MKTHHSSKFQLIRNLIVLYWFIGFLIYLFPTNTLERLPNKYVAHTAELNDSLFALTLIPLVQQSDSVHKLKIDLLENLDNNPSSDSSSRLLAESYFKLIDYPDSLLEDYANRNGSVYEELADRHMFIMGIYNIYDDYDFAGMRHLSDDTSRHYRWSFDPIKKYIRISTPILYRNDLIGHLYSRYSMAEWYGALVVMRIEMFGICLILTAIGFGLGMYLKPKKKQPRHMKLSKRYQLR